MSWDPTLDPRFLPPDEEIPEDLSGLVVDLEKELARYDEMERMFSSYGWGYITEQLRREAANLDLRCQREKDPQQWFLWRGQAMTVWYLLDLPDRVSKARRRVMDSLQRLVQEEE